MGGGMGALFGWMSWRAKGYVAIYRQKLQAATAEGQARILSARETALEINEAPELELEVEVTPAIGASFKSRLRVLRSQLPLLRADTLLQVRYDPKKPEEVFLRETVERYLKRAGAAKRDSLSSWRGQRL